MKYVVVDIDGTLSKVGERLKYLQQDPPDWDRFYRRRCAGIHKSSYIEK